MGIYPVLSFSEDIEKEREEFFRLLSSLYPKDDARVDDLMKLKLYEDTLWKSRRFLVDVFDSIEEGIDIIDKDLNIVRTNRVLEMIFRDLMPIVGKRCYTVFAARNRPCDQCPSLMAMKDKKAHSVIMLLFEGTEMEAWVRITAFPLLDADGNIMGIIEHSRNVTESKNAVDALRGAEERYRSIVESVSDIIWEMDRNFIFTYVNPRVGETTGCSPSEILGRSIFDHMSADEAARFMKVLKPITDRREPFYQEKACFIGADGREVFTEATGTPVFDSNGELWGYRGIARDISERMRAEASLAEAKSQVDLYLDLMGHDINNMNQIGMGFLELALSTLELDEHGRSLISSSLMAFENSSRLIDNVRKLQKVRSGELCLKEVDAGLVLADVCRHYAGISGVTINYEPVAGAAVMANELLFDLFSNLIGNAIKHSISSPVIDIRLNMACDDGENVYRISVEDNGPGIPDDMKTLIFERQAGSAPLAKGSGIGLYLVKALADNFHGRVWVEDRVKGDYGHGSRFVVLLPAVKR